MKRRGGSHRRPAALAVTLGLALVALGCGEKIYNEVPETKEQALAAVETWLGACANEDSEAVLEILTPTSREIVISAPSILAGCQRVARLGLPPEAEPAKLEDLFQTAHVEHVEADGGYGRAVLRSAMGTTSELQLEVDRGQWHVSNPPLVAP